MRGGGGGGGVKDPRHKTQDVKVAHGMQSAKLLNRCVSRDTCERTAIYPIKPVGSSKV